MRTLFEPLEASTLRRRIADRIGAAVLDGTLKEGERLVERRLAAQFATSLTAVREALIELEADGFVSKKANAATYVTKLTPEAGKRIFAVRRLLEAYAVEEAARLATPDQVRKLDQAYANVLSAARSKKRELFLQLDFQFHEKIWLMADNEYLRIALRRVLVPIYAFSAMRIHSGNAFDLLQDAQSHLPVLEAIKAKNPELARRRFLEALDGWYSATDAYVLAKSNGGAPTMASEGAILALDRSKKPHDKAHRKRQERNSSPSDRHGTV